MSTVSDSNFPSNLESKRTTLKEQGIEYGLLGLLQGPKYEYRNDITDRASLEKNFREKFEALNRVTLSDAQFARLLDEIVSPDGFVASKTLRNYNAFTRDDGTPLNYSLVNIKDWCKNQFEVIDQLRMITDNSHHRYDVLLLVTAAAFVLEKSTLRYVIATRRHRTETRGTRRSSTQAPHYKRSNRGTNPNEQRWICSVGVCMPLRVPCQLRPMAAYDFMQLR